MKKSYAAFRRKHAARRRKSASVDQDDIRRQQDNYARIVELMNLGEGNYAGYRYVGMEEFFRILFERDGQLRLQEKGKDHYHDGHYNAIIRKVSKGGKASHSWWIVTDAMNGIEQYKRAKFAITSPVTYIGKERSLFRREQDADGKFKRADHTHIGNARYLFGIAVDIDKVYPRNLNFLLAEIKRNHYPEPTMIVTSGTGIHVYYCFTKPVRITEDNLDLLNRFKYSVTAMLWRYNGTSQQRKVEFHNIGQGYRFPDTQTKFERIVLGWMKGDRPRYYTLRELNGYVKLWQHARPELFEKTKILQDASIKYLEHDCNKICLDAKELQQLEKDMRKPAHWSIETARRKFGEEWYQYVQEHGSKDWTYSENFYNRWLNRITYSADVTVGHRYWCIYILACWAFNCNIPFSRLQKDAYGLLEHFNEIEDDENERRPFTIRDCNAALTVYKERKKRGETKAIRLSRASTERVTGVNILPNKRNFNSLSVHGKKRLQQRVQNALEEGKDWKDDITGRPTKEKIIAEWREEHPEGTQYACAKELGIDKKTVRKWWNNTEQEWKAERKDSQLTSGYTYTEENPKEQELHDIRAAYNSGFVTDRKVAEATMQHVEGYEAQTPETICKTRDELTDAINKGALKMEDIMRSMGVPEFLIPMLKDEFERQSQTPEFWEKYKKAIQNGSNDGGTDGRRQ